jgi:hypothetical protein
MNKQQDKIDFSDGLKKIFDHFRNYLIAASLLYVGLESLTHPEWHSLGELGDYFSYWVIAVSVVLILLNTLGVVLWIYNNIKPISIPGKNKKKGVLAMPIVILNYIAFVYVIVVVAINLKLV